MVLQWIPAHVGTRGNETANMLAKAGSQLPQPHRSTSYNEAQTVLKQNSKTNGQNRHHGYCPQHDHTNTLERREPNHHLPPPHWTLWSQETVNTRKRWGLQRQHSVNVARLNRHQSTFSKSAHSMKGRHDVLWGLQRQRSVNVAQAEPTPEHILQVCPFYEETS